LFGIATILGATVFSAFAGAQVTSGDLKAKLYGKFYYARPGERVTELEISQ
jgi:hypothetical protein